MTHDHSPANEGLTRNQSLVLGKLESADGPLSAYAILGALREDGLRAPLQVYRALDRLIELGLVHRLESLNAFVACDQSCSTLGPIAFAICDGCGQVDEFSDKAIAHHLNVWAQAKKFDLNNTVIELRGTCQSCETN